uniref:NADH-ubiquinone oxidoreductase chain 2 n=1 Tax=Corbicula fluminea TaxID=45949 RepID=A0A8E5NIU9_CORFM|nr:NADH dehydrogenase subunit 2 [Corbicula fluminea]QYH50567.1 NADH dehydrogenase subunit 2 [Corbicula sp. QL-2021]WNS59843.1 NADH dehydrogenase subunit 2 [Corbicula fluminea]
MVFTLVPSLASWLSFFMLGVGIFWSLCSASIFGAWVAMELSFIGVVGLLGGSSYDESESLVKYFVVQVIGSSLLMASIVFLLSGCFLSLVEVVFLLGLFLKLGLFPFHFWVPSVMSGLTWLGCFIVSVVQKIIPMWFLANFCISSFGFSMVEFSSVLTCLMGCVGGLMVLHFRVLLGYSSLVHMGFMAMMSLESMISFFVYYIVYFIVNAGLMLSLWCVSVYSFFDLLKSKNGNSFVWISLYLLSLAGVPPFVGSFVKVVFLLKVWSVFPMICVVLLVSSAVSMFFYLSFFMGLYFSLGGSFFVSNYSFGLMSKNFTLLLMSLVINVVVSIVLFSMVGLM